MGTGTWTCSGVWDTRSVGTLNYDVSTLVFDAATGSHHYPTSLYNLTISALNSINNLFSVYGHCAIDSTFNVFKDIDIYGSLAISASGVKAGGNRITLRDGADVTEHSGSWSNGTLFIRFDSTGATSQVAGGTYLTISTVHNSTASSVIQLQGAVVLDTLELSTFKSSGQTWDQNNQDLTILGDVSFNESLGSVTWGKGTGTITLGGSFDQSLDFAGKQVENISIDKTAGTVALAGNLDTDGISWVANASNTFILDADMFDVTIGTDGLNCTNGADYTIQLGSGTWTCAGDWDAADVGAYTQETSEVVLTGVSNLAMGLHDFYKLTISGTIAASSLDEIHNTLTIDITKQLTLNDFFTQTTGGKCNINGALVIGAGGRFTTNRNTTIGSSGVVSGARFIQSGSLFDNSAGGSVTVTRLDISQNGSFSDGTYDCGASGIVIGNAGGNRTTIAPATATFNCLFHLLASENGSMTFDTATNDSSLVFHDDILAQEVGATAAWSRGTGALTLDGSNDQAITLLGLVVEDFVIDKLSGTTTFASDFVSQSLAITDAGTAVVFSTYTFDFFDGWTGQDVAEVDYASATIYSLGPQVFPLIGGAISGEAVEAHDVAEIIRAFLATLSTTSRFSGTLAMTPRYTGTLSTTPRYKGKLSVE
jgi:hypothetical protein